MDCQHHGNLVHHLTRALLLAEGWTAVLIYAALVRARRAVTPGEAAVRDAIQQLLDEQGDGWQVAQVVIVMGLERMTDGSLDSTPWLWSPPDQPGWQTDGLLEVAMGLPAAADDD